MKIEWNKQNYPDYQEYYLFCDITETYSRSDLTSLFNTPCEWWCPWPWKWEKSHIIIYENDVNGFNELHLADGRRAAGIELVVEPVGIDLVEVPVEIDLDLAPVDIEPVEEVVGIVVAK